MKLSNLRIGARLSLGFGLLLVLLVGVSGMAARQAGSIYSALDYYQVNTTPSLEAVRTWQSESDRIRMLQAQHVMASTDAEMTALEHAIGQAGERLHQSVRAYEALLSNDEDKRLWQDVTATTRAAWAGWERLKAASRSTASDPAQSAVAKSLFTGESEAQHKLVAAAIDREWKFNVGLARELAADGKATYHLALTSIGLACAVALAVGVAAALVITRSITRPIHQAVHIAQTVAAGDLTLRIAAAGKDEPAQLLQALGRMNESLLKTVREVRLGSDSVATGSSQIATGNADLSQRTEEQASNLQQTAASMEELTSTVKNNAENSAQATELAAAAQGGGAVAQVVATMHDIATSSRKIADITGVIDGIAFQTNILSLNAAVEAARAGEQGRGFAVVASEVRLLAQRSAVAAKEIKALIGASVEKVETGSRQAGDAGQTMADIVGRVQRVSQLIAEISHATSEQLTGISQVGDAVGQLDQVTQQNAALVEQSAAAAESLKNQANRLAEAVAVFRLA